MAFSEILVYGNKLLRGKSSEITEFDEDLRKLVNKMYDTMYKAGGIGLAAPQVGVMKRLVVLDILHYEGPKIALINPVIKSRSRLTDIHEEGCLSVPGIRGDVVRSKKIEIEAWDVEGKTVVLKAREMFARVVQHETDHLDGILFIDHLDELGREQVNTELEKIKNMGQIAVA